MARRAGVDLTGELMRCVEVQEAYEEEMAKCEVLQERYRAGKLEWQEYEEESKVEASVTAVGEEVFEEDTSTEGSSEDIEEGLSSEEE